MINHTPFFLSLLHPLFPFLSVISLLEIEPWFFSSYGFRFFESGSISHSPYQSGTRVPSASASPSCDDSRHAPAGLDQPLKLTTPPLSGPQIPITPRCFQRVIANFTLRNFTRRISQQFKVTEFQTTGLHSKILSFLVWGDKRIPFSKWRLSWMLVYFVNVPGWQRETLVAQNWFYKYL